MESRVSRTPIEKLNVFHPVELVLWQRDLTKLASHFKGPYEVIGSNKEILRHVKALVTDENSDSTWSDDVNLALVFFVMNYQVNSETGFRL